MTGIAPEHLLFYLGWSVWVDPVKIARVLRR
jgi:hypothetical protein